MAKTKPPHIPALPEEYEKKPSSRYDWSIVPPLSGVMYRVEDGENFESYAIFAGMNVWDLIYYNFHTKVPQEVNWYLRNVVGCKKLSLDGMNYSFSDDADPGIIYFPMWAYKHLIESGRTPRPIVEDEEFYVSGSVPGFIQRGPTCWAAAFAMMVGWEERKRKPIADVLDEAGDGGWWTRQYTRGHGLSAGHTASLARKLGLTGETKVPSDAAGWLRALEKHGPLMLVQSSIEGWVHWIVVTGFRTQFPDTVELRYLDPFNSARVFGDLQTLQDDANTVDWGYARYYHF